MMQALSKITIIQGVPSISPELMMALIYRNVPTCDINFIQNDEKACKIEARRKPSQPWQIFCFSMDDAKKAGLTNKDVWKKYTRAMLRSRAVSEMGRSLFPDALMGCSYTPEEMGSVVDADNIVIEPEVIEPKAPTPGQEATIKDLKAKAIYLAKNISDDKFTAAFKATKQEVIAKMTDEKNSLETLTMIKAVEAASTGGAVSDKS